MKTSRSDSGYERLAEEAERPQTIRDHTHRWEKLQPLGSVNGTLEQRVRRFCESKRITPEALLMLEPRLRVGAGGHVEIAFAGRAPNGAVVAIKVSPPRGLIARDACLGTLDLAAPDRRRAIRRGGLAARRGRDGRMPAARPLPSRNHRHGPSLRREDVQA
jgi:hypothetical protein